MPRYNFEAPPYCPDAKPTSIGWAHPETGEQLVSRKGLENPVSYYKPNAGKKSFSPDGTTPAQPGGKKKN